MKNRLIIFIKNPVKGKVKTRLAATIGEDKALSVYLKLLKRTREVSSHVQAKRLLFYSDAIDWKDEWSANMFQKHVQLQSKDLGERMGKAFKVSFNDGPVSTVIIGSDCPEISTEIIDQAFEGLLKHDIVIGPSLDGGYYLLGMKTYHSELFSEIEWSTPSVFESTLEKARSIQLSVSLLPELSDLDDEKDLYRLHNKL